MLSVRVPRSTSSSNLHVELEEERTLEPSRERSSRARTSTATVSVADVDGKASRCRSDIARIDEEGDRRCARSSRRPWADPRELQRAEPAVLAETPLELLWQSGSGSKQTSCASGKAARDRGELADVGADVDHVPMPRACTKQAQLAEHGPRYRTEQVLALARSRNMA